MCSIKLEDINGDVTDVVFFPKVWDQYRDIVQVDAPILIEGRLDKTRGAPQLSASKASSLLVNGIAESDAYYADTYSEADRDEELTPEAKAAAGSRIAEASGYFGPPPMDDGWFDELPPMEDVPMMTDPFDDLPPVSPEEMPDACGALTGPAAAEKPLPETEDAKAVLFDKPTISEEAAAEVSSQNVPEEQFTRKEPKPQSSDTEPSGKSLEPNVQDDDDPPFDIDEPPAKSAVSGTIKPISEANIAPMTGFFTDPEDDEKTKEPFDPVQSAAGSKTVSDISPVISRFAPEPEDLSGSDGSDGLDSVDSLDEELFSFDDRPQPKLLTVVVHIEPNAQPGSSGRRIRRLHGLVSSYPGRDHVAFMIIEGGKVYLVDFPNVHTNICRDLLNKLREQVGEDNIQIEEKAPVR